jgi:recombination protein RecA
MIYGLGISKVGEILDLSVELEVCRKSGAWYYYGDMRLGQGRENAKKYLLENADLMDEIEKLVRAKADELDIDDMEDDTQEVQNTSAESKTEETVAADVSGESKTKAATPKKTTAKKTATKKAILIEGEEDFEEFSPDEL